MARFRKIDPKIWNDAKFTALSNDAKLLFIYLLTSPMMTVLGAVPMRSPAVAAELGFDSKRYAIRYKELYDMGIVEYDDRGLFWVKNFLKYNAPDNPKVVISWSGAVDLLPECGLLTKVIENAKNHCFQRGSGFSEAFENSIGNRMRYGMANGIENGITYPMPYKEKEREKERDIDSQTAEPSAPSHLTSKIVDLYNEIASDHFPQMKVLTDKRKKAVKRFADFLRKQTKSADDDALLSEAKSYFLRASRCDFLCGKNDRGWKADFDFLVNENKAVLVLEGKYDNSTTEKHEEPSIHKVKNPGPPPSKDDDGWKAQEAYFRRIGMFKGLAS